MDSIGGGHARTLSLSSCFVLVFLQDKQDDDDLDGGGKTISLPVDIQDSVIKVRMALFFHASMAQELFGLRIVWTQSCHRSDAHMVLSFGAF